MAIQTTWENCTIETVEKLADASSPEQVLANARHIISCGYPFMTEDLIRAAAKENPSAAFIHAERYADQDFAYDLLSELAEKFPEDALYYAESYLGTEHGIDIIECAAVKDPAAVIEHLNNLPDNAAAAVLKAIAEENTTLVLSNYEKYADKPYAEEVFDRCDLDPQSLEDEVDVWLNGPAVMRNYITKNYPYLVLCEADQFPKDSEIVRNAVNTTTAEIQELASTILKKADEFIDQDFAPSLITLAAKTDPEAALEYSYKFAKQPYAKDIYRDILAKGYVEDTINDIRNFVNQPYAPEILQEIIAKGGAEAVAEHIPSFVKQPYAGQVLLALAEKEPEEVLAYEDNFASQPYAKEVIAVAENAIEQWKHEGAATKPVLGSHTERLEQEKSSPKTNLPPRS